MFLDSDYILSENELGVRSRELNRHVRQTVTFMIRHVNRWGEYFLKTLKRNT